MYEDMGFMWVCRSQSDLEANLFKVRRVSHTSRCSDFHFCFHLLQDWKLIVSGRGFLFMLLGGWVKS